MERKSLTSMLSSSLYFLPGSFIMLLILAVQSEKIRFYIEKVIFLFTFFDKSLVISRIFHKFAVSYPSWKPLRVEANGLIHIHKGVLNALCLTCWNFATSNY